MDLRTTIGLALIATALVLGSMAFAADPEGAQSESGFLSVPKRKMDWLRLLLVALVAYTVGVQLFSRFGYTIPLLQPLQPLRSEVVLIYPLVLLGLGSVVALFLDRRSGVVFTLISVLLIGFTVLNPMHR